MPENHAPPKEFVEWRRLHYERREGRTSVSEARANEDWKRYGPGWRAAIDAAAKAAKGLDDGEPTLPDSDYGHGWDDAWRDCCEAVAAEIAKLAGKGEE